MKSDCPKCGTALNFRSLDRTGNAKRCNRCAASLNRNRHPAEALILFLPALLVLGVAMGVNHLWPGALFGIAPWAAFLGGTAVALACAAIAALAIHRGLLREFQRYSVTEERATQ